jgi:hypothetical protein
MAKRRLGASGTADGEQVADNVSRDEMEELFSSLRDEFSGKVEAGFSAMQAVFTKTVGEKLKKMEKDNDTQFQEHTMQISEIHRRIAHLEGERPQLRAQMVELQQGLAVAEKAATQVPVEAGSEEFDRPLDTTIIKIRCKEELSRQEVLASIQCIIDEMGSMGTGESGPAFTITGKEVGKYHILQFKGAGGLAQGRARKFMQLQRLPGDAGWRKLKGNDEHGQQQDIYVDGDKNRRMVSTEILTKKLGALIAKHVNGLKVIPKRAEGKIWVGWTPVAWITVTSREEFSVQWNLKKTMELGLPREQIEVALRGAGRLTEDVEWG